MWDKLYETEAAFKPEVNGELDTQNFMKFDEVLHSLAFLLSFELIDIVVVSIVVDNQLLVNKHYCWYYAVMLLLWFLLPRADPVQEAHWT